MAPSILLSVDKNKVSVAPGANVELAVTVQNLTTLLDQVAVRVEGLDPTWVQVIPQYLPVFAQGQATARVILKPTRNPAQAVAGVYPLRIRATAQEHPGEEGEAASEMTLQMVGEYEVRLEAASPLSPQEASYPVRVRNAGNAPLQIRLTGADAGAALWYKFDPFQLLVPPGGEAQAALTVRAKQSGAGSRAITFTLTAQGEYQPQNGGRVAAATQQVNGQFLSAAQPKPVVNVEPIQGLPAYYSQYRVRVGNPGGANLVVRLAATDDAHELAYVLDPEEFKLAPQSEGQSTLTVQPARQAQLDAQPRAFRVVVQSPTGEFPPVSAVATFMPVTAAPPRREFPWVIVLSALLGLCLALIILIIVFGQFGR